MKLTLPLMILFASALHGAHADAIDDYVNRELERQHIPGAAIGIFERGMLVRAQGYGLADVEHGVPVHVDTVFQSGSIGKQFTAVIVMLLVEEGKLKLDESVRTYLPAAPRSWSSISVRHLLTHTSGLPGDPGYDLRRDYSDDELLAIFAKMKLEFPPGSRWSYSNPGYELLGILIKKVSGEFYGDLLARRVFGPLHMNSARVISERDIVMNRASGYEFTGTLMHNQDWVSPTANSVADGSLYLTVLDFAKWEAGLRAGAILKPESWAEVYKPVKLTSGRTYPYGFGWFLESYAGQEVHQHDGAWQGFTTSFVRYLGAGVSAVVLTNRAGADPALIARGIAGVYDAKLSLPAAKPIEDRQPPTTAEVRRLLGDIAQGTVKQTAFAGVFADAPAEDFRKLMQEYRDTMTPLGALQELQLFRARQLGDDEQSWYRARFEHGFLDINIVIENSKLVDQFYLTTVPAWDAPLQP